METEVARQVAERIRQLAGTALPTASVEPERPAAEEEAPARRREGRPRGPRFSEVEAPFLKDKAAVYSGQTTAQVRATFRLWLELIGDKPVSDYTGADAGRFRELILRMPASHGKGGHVNALDAIRAADLKEAKSGPPVRRVSMKTAKRHFSALSQLWEWLLPPERVAKNIFRGFSFPGTKAKRTARDDWAAEDLIKVLTSDWYGPDVPRDSAQWWLPVIAMYSGLRLEEAARLRPADVVTVSGVHAFLIKGHPDGWTPKTEAGERYVPVHPCSPS
ncbi:hypothetical protein ACFQU7_08745 [Pseudoroseomonas wenyumeiae]